MSEEKKERKYKFESMIKLPDMQEILDAASDFTPPSEKKLEVTTPVMEKEKKSVMELAQKPALSPEQEELQRLGLAVANEEVRRAKEKERQRAEELRRLCREREELAKKKEEEEKKIATEEMKKAIQAAKEKAQARKDAASAEEEKEAELASREELSIEEQIELMPVSDSGFKMPPIVSPKEEPSQDVSETEEPSQAESFGSDDDTMVDISELAVNPFEDRPIMKRIKEKEAFKETILEDDYKEEMDLREDTSESVDEDFLDF